MVGYMAVSMIVTTHRQGISGVLGKERVLMAGVVAMGGRALMFGGAGLAVFSCTLGTCMKTDVGPTMVAQAPQPLTQTLATDAGTMMVLATPAPACRRLP